MLYRSSTCTNTPPSTDATRRTRRSRASVGSRRRRGLSTAVAIAAGALVGVAAMPNTVSAGRSWSEAIASQAQDALDELDAWQRTGAKDDEVAYELLRDKLANTIAGAVGADAGALRRAWDQVEVANQRVILTAATQIGVPYRYAASKPGVAFDCSGLMLYAYRSVGVELPRVSGAQIRSGEKVSAEEAEPGDLAQYPGHVMMYVGPGVILHSPQTGSYVQVAHQPKRKLRFADVTPKPTAAAAQRGGALSGSATSSAAHGVRR